MGFIWNKESIEVATRMWSTGNSAGKIAEYFGITRGTVMGKLSRLGLMKDPLRKTIEKLERKADPIPLIPAPEPKHLTFMELKNGQCKWPHGESPYTFCGHDAEPERPYCAHHMQASVFRRDL